MGRLPLFLLGVMVGAAGMVYLLFETGRLQAPGQVARQSTTTTTAAPADAPSAVELPALPSAPVPGLPLPFEPRPMAPLPDTGTPLPPDPTVLGDQNLLVPVQGVAASGLVDTYTQSRGDGRLHDAIDIMAARGTPVLAVADGRVAKLFDSARGGLTVYQFDREEKLVYYYAHLDRYAPGLAEGNVLRRGDLIGTVGSSGNADPAGPHLHFAVLVLGAEKRWWQATAVNPYPLLGGR